MMDSHQKTVLSYGARREVLAQIALRYQQATGAQKTLLLDRAVELTGYARKSAIRLQKVYSRIKEHMCFCLFPFPLHCSQEIVTTSLMFAHFCSNSEEIWTTSPFLPPLLLSALNRLEPGST